MLGGPSMPLLCRIGRHKPARTKALIDINDLSQRTYCKRCGAVLERDTGSPWSERKAA